jgi:transcriptional regulator with XRE-family HTH domain
MTVLKQVLMVDQPAAFGSEVRQMRKARRMTLKDLERDSGVSVSHLSAIERGASKPSMDVIHAIADALSVSPDWFFARRPGAGPLERACIVRERNRRDLNSLYSQAPDELGYADRLVSSSIGGAFYMGIADYPAVPADGVDETLQSHEGEQHGIVIEGQLELQLEDEIIVLQTGDSYTFDGRIPHRVRNRSDKTAVLIWAASPVVIPKDTVHRPEAETKRRPAAKARR